MQIPASILRLFGRRDPARDVDTIIVHHSAAPSDRDIEELAEMERVDQGFLAIGYHRYLKWTPSGWVAQSGRPAWAIPAAAYGMNVNSYDVCVGGNYHPAAHGENLVSPALMDALVLAIMDARRACPKASYLIGHRDVAAIKAKGGADPAQFATACPGDRLVAVLPQLRLRTGLAQHPAL